MQQNNPHHDLSLSLLPQGPPAPVEATPVIATVMSLAGPPTEKNSVPNKTAEQSKQQLPPYTHSIPVLYNGALAV